MSSLRFSFATMFSEAVMINKSLLLCASAMIVLALATPQLALGAPASSSTPAPSTNVVGDAGYWNYGNAAPQDLSRSQIMSSQMNHWDDAHLDPLRRQMIQAAAASLGSQAGLLARSREIQQALLVRASDYDKVFDFSKIMLEPGFLPPVITEGRNAYNQPNDNQARASDRIFRIERPARLVSVAPTWRTYLLTDPTPPARPDLSTLPKTAEEKRLWDDWAGRGWDEGAHLADENFEANLARLRQDFQGMLRFKMLYEQGLVSKPQINRSSLGVTGGGDELAINDRIIEITQKASLDANTQNWSTNHPQTDPRDQKRP